MRSIQIENAKMVGNTPTLDEYSNYAELLIDLISDCEKNGDFAAADKYKAELVRISRISNRKPQKEKDRDGRPVFPGETPEDYSSRLMREDMELWARKLDERDFKSPVVKDLAPIDIMRAIVLSPSAAVNSLNGKYTERGDRDRKPVDTEGFNPFSELPNAWRTNPDIMSAYALLGTGISQKAVKQITAARIRHNIQKLKQIVAEGKISPRHTPIEKIAAEYGLFIDTPRERVYIRRFLKMAADIRLKVKEQDRKAAIFKAADELSGNVRTIATITLNRLNVPQPRFKQQKTARKSEGGKNRSGAGNTAEENAVLSFIHENMPKYSAELAYMRTIRRHIRHNRNNKRQLPVTLREYNAFKKWCDLAAVFYGE